VAAHGTRARARMRRVQQRVRSGIGSARAHLSRRAHASQTRFEASET
jgi:hypothetical protein